MAKFKHIDTGPRFLPVVLEQQLIPGTFEHALHHLLDNEIDLAHIEARYRNDDNGAPAYPPALLLKVILLGYARGMVSSRALARACETNVVFMALCGDHAPHFTTIAGFIRHLGDEIAPLFAQVLWLCDRQGLIGRELFAIDGVKLPSNASKHKSGTRADFQKQLSRLEQAAQQMLKQHRKTDDEADTVAAARDEARAARKLARLQKDAESLREWLATNPDDKIGSRCRVLKSNRTDNDSAKMATSHGVIQGYAGVATVDAKHQIVLHAEAHGTGSEHSLLLPSITAVEQFREPNTVITADAGYHSDANMAALEAKGINALIADTGMRQRDERFATQARHKQRPDPLHDKSANKKKPAHFTPSDFHYDPEQGSCHCPTGKPMARNGGEQTIRGYRAVMFKGMPEHCGTCPKRAQCLRHPERTQVRQVAFFKGRADKSETASDRMRNHIDSPEGRALYSRRLGTVEPVFGNLRHNKGMRRFTLRGKKKVNTQWNLMCMVHNIEKLAKSGYAVA